MSRISGGLGQCFDTVREVVERVISEHEDRLSEEEEALNNIEEAFERRDRWAHQWHGLARRLQRMLQDHISWLRGGENWSEAATARLKARGDELETQLLTELGNLSLDKMPPKALVELGVAVASALERRGITAFPVQLGGDGKIQGPGAPEEG